MVKFLVFADLHYKKRMYAVGVEHLQAIMARAAEEQVAFVIHAGDLCNDYKGSPELTKAYLCNPYGLPVYGIYGNHELESEGNTIEVVNPLLCNRPVRWGGTDGGYWYTDVAGYRLIGLDTNYSYNEQADLWEHNRPASWGAPQGNRLTNSVGPTQRAWLAQVLEEAAQKELPVLVFAHGALSGEWHSCPDAAEVRTILARHPNLVKMVINGHLHTDHLAVVDGIVHFDVNAVINGHWEVMHEQHYTAEHTYPFTDYDAEGNPLGTCPLSMAEPEQGKNTWFFESPLSAVVTIEDDGSITICGAETRWAYDVVPINPPDGAKPCIPDRKI